MDDTVTDQVERQKPKAPSRLAIISPGGAFKYLNGANVEGGARFHMHTMRGFATDHACIGARTLAQSGEGFYMAVYPDMKSVTAAVMFIQDLEQYYLHSDAHADSLIRTFAAIFINHPIYSQEQFADEYWDFAQILHDVDCLSNPYDPTVSFDPYSADFELSLAGRAVFTTTLNPQSPRMFRNSSFPVWVMNQTAQFQQLRDEGRFEKWKDKIRKRDALYDPSGESNPILADHGSMSAKDQLAGSPPEHFNFTVNDNVEKKVEAIKRLLKMAQDEGADAYIIDELIRRADVGAVPY